MRFVLKTSGREIVTTARRMDDVALTVFGSRKDFAIVCCAQATAHKVYLTWRAADATAVAVEFMPNGYTPQP